MGTSGGRTLPKTGGFPGGRLRSRGHLVESSLAARPGGTQVGESEGLGLIVRRGLLALFALGWAACSAPERPNVLIVTFDTTRYDHVGVNGDRRARTPNVDGLAARGIVFDHAYAPVGLTLPSHTTMMSGLPPITHGVHNNGRFIVPPRVETLAERLKAAGYETGAFVSAWVLDSRFQLDQGFDVYGDEVHSSNGPLELTVPSRPADEVVDEALEWLGDRSGEAPFFLWAHFYDPHLPRTVKAPFDRMTDAYRAEVAFADQEFGRLLEAVEAETGGRPLMVVLTSDHGESLGQHGEATHGHVAYDSTLHVPLVMAGPGIPTGRRSDALARHTDLVPTVLAAVGLPPDESLPGRDLLAAHPDDQAVGYFESRSPHFDLGWSPLAGVRTQRWKYTATPEPRELFDIHADPEELENLFESQPEVAAELEARFQALTSEVSDLAQEAERGEVSQEEAAQLAALGYVAVPKTPDATPADPRRFVKAFGLVESARGAAMSGRWAQGIEILETLRTVEVLETLVLRTLATLYEHAGRFEDAMEAFRAYAELTEAREAQVGHIRAAIRAGKLDEAIAAAEAVDPPGPDVAMLHSRALARQGRHEEAAAIVEDTFKREGMDVARARGRAAVILDVAPYDGGLDELRTLVERAPGDPGVESALGYYLAVWGEDGSEDEARALLAKAREAAGEDPEVQARAGWGAYHLGDDEDAIVALERVLELDARRTQDRARLGFVQWRAGRNEDARISLATALRERPGAAWAPDVRRGLQELAKTMQEEAAAREATP